MKPKINENSKQSNPVARLPLKFKQRGKGYLQFAGALLLSGGIMYYIVITESKSARWLSAETLLLAVIFALPGVLFLLVGFHYYTRKSEIVLYRDRVQMVTKTLFMRKPRVKSFPMNEFTGVIAACEKGKNITLHYVMLTHPVLSRSVVVAREFPNMEAAKKRRDELARILQLPVLKPGENDASQ